MIAFLFFIASVWLPGLALCAALVPKHISVGRALALSFPAGAALLTSELFLYFVVGRFSFAPGLLCFAGLQAAIALAYVGWRLWQRRAETFAFPKLKPLQWLLGALIGLLLFSSLVLAASKPPIAYDSVAFWALRAKILLRDGHVDFNPDSQTFLSTYSHKNYPWHVSLLEYWFRQLGGGDSGVALIAWLYFLSCALLLAQAMARRWGTGGLFLTLLFCSQPLLFYHSYNNYADLVLGCYAAAGFIFLLDWLRDRRISDLMLAAAGIGFTLTVKNYGIFYIIALGVALAVALMLKRLDRRELGWALGALLFPVLPLALFKVFFHLNLRNTEAAWGWHPESLRPIGEALFWAGSWNIWWPAFIGLAVALAATIWRKRELRIAWAFFLSALLILLTVFFVTENYQWALDQTAFSRGLIPLVPISILLIEFSFSYVPAPHPRV